VSQVRQRPGNPVIAPIPALTGHANDQPLDLSLDPRPARTSTRRAIELAGDKLAIPAQDGIRSGYGRDVGENLATQTMTDLAEHASLGVREPQPTIQLRLDDAVLGGQIFVPRQKLLIYRPRHVGQDTRPIHYRPPAPHRPSANSSEPPRQLLPTSPSPLNSRPFQFFYRTASGLDVSQPSHRCLRVSEATLRDLDDTSKSSR
jgi:hypothetical protein